MASGKVGTQLQWGFVKHLPKRERKPRMSHPLDAILTLDLNEMTLVYALVALDAGMGVGIRSSKLEMARKGQPRVLSPDGLPWYQRLPFTFVDNNWHSYDHGQHMAAIELVRPKYATVRDYVTKRQAEAIGVPYYPLDRILAWAEQVEQHAQHAIVIPKDITVLPEIPQHHVIGYSVPTSYGGSPFLIEQLRGRRIHLLGGAWAAQRALLDEMGDDVVSIDFNALQLVAKYGTVVFPDGDSKALDEMVEPWKLVNPMTAATVLSLGFISAALTNDYAPASAQAKARKGIQRAQFTEG